MEKYRRMTVNERLALTIKLTEEKLPLLLQGTPEEVRRRFDLLNRDKDERNRLIADGLYRSMRGDDRPAPPTGHAIDEELANNPSLAKDIEEWL
jgi:phage terminase Nu1 subunit (DNA packaging protein)